MSCHPDKGGTAAEFKAMSAAHDKRAAELAESESRQEWQRNKKADGTYKTAAEILAELQAVLNSDACRPYIDNKSGSDTLYVEYYVEEAEYTRDDESEGWEFSAGSMYYEREADNTPMSDRKKASL